MTLPGPHADGFYTFFTLAHPRYYESLQTYECDPVFSNLLRDHLPPSWVLTRSSEWLYASPPGGDLPAQGWKLHVSSRPENAIIVLERTAGACVDLSAPFKVLADPTLLIWSLDKAWPRASSGKFITIYPLSDHLFRPLAEQLIELLRDFPGAYILTDRQAFGSHCVYYRYGGFRSSRRMLPDGTFEYFIMSPNGVPFVDTRGPAYVKPPWVEDPLGALQGAPDASDGPSEDTEETAVCLCNGRFAVHYALKFAPTGGVYVGTDLDTSRSVIIKEARPHTGFDAQGRDAVQRLERQFGLLTHLAGRGCRVPNPIARFDEWEHHFLVEDYIPGPDLAIFGAANNPLLSSSDSLAARKEYAIKLKSIWLSIVDLVRLLHAENVSLDDLTIKNLIINEDTLDVYLIDLETSGPLDEPHSGISTVGFNAPASLEDPLGRDYYAMACCLLSTIMPINGLVDLEPSVYLARMTYFCNLIGLNSQLMDYVFGIVGAAAAGSWNASAVSGAAASSLAATIGRWQPTPWDPAYDFASLPSRDVSCLDVARQTLSVADLSRADRVFPGDPRGFVTSSEAIAYGTAGVLLFLASIKVEIPRELVRRFISSKPSSDTHPIGLLRGLGGIGWVGDELGCTDFGASCRQVARQAARDAADPTLSTGLSGLGVSWLRSHYVSGDASDLTHAFECGERLIDLADRDWEGNAYWRDQEGDVQLGLADGIAGVIGFLSQLSLASKETKYARVAQSGMRFVIQHCIRETGRISVPRGKLLGKGRPVTSPYWADGAAGVAQALVCLLRVPGIADRDKMMSDLRGLVSSFSRGYMLFTGFYNGMAGLIPVLIDSYRLLGDETLVDRAFELRGNILSCAIAKQNGHVFPGDQQLRESYDFATGSAGVGMVLSLMEDPTSNPRPLDPFCNSEATDVRLLNGLCVADTTHRDNRQPRV